jgi:hypothetical protein
MLSLKEFRRQSSSQGGIYVKAAASVVVLCILFTANRLRFGQGNWEDRRSNPRTWTTGNVGIGTASPLSPLYINGTHIQQFIGTGRGVLSLSGNFKGFVPLDFLHNDGANPTARIAAFHDGSGSNLVFGTSRNYAGGITNIAMSIDARGYIGMGTTQPESKLHIFDGDVTLENGLKMTFKNSDGINDGTAIFREDPGEFGRRERLLFQCAEGVSFNMQANFPFQISNSSNHSVFLLYPNGNAYFYNTGNVGIGTHSPQSKLAVNGKITCTEVEVTLDGWSDFVFADDYSLMPLEEVEKHIQQNRHLPDIPSEEEVLENGLNLGDMQARLLQKVEELTLYMIQLKKENEVLKKRISMLEK